MPQPTCSVVGCSNRRRYVQTGYCSKHYARLRRHGTLEMETPRYSSLEERITARSKLDPVSGCIIWTGYRNPAGYGQVAGLPGEVLLAHRANYERVKGPIPPGMHLDHLCHTDDLHCQGSTMCPHRACINPDHLEVVTNAENTARGLATFARLGMCRKNLHDVTDPANLYVDPTGKRQCRPCHAEAQRLWRSRHKPQR